MYRVGDLVQIVNHSEPRCNGHYGTVLAIELTYAGEPYYSVHLQDMDIVCSCTADEVMEG